MRRFPLFPAKMLKVSPVSLCMEHTVQANSTASKSYQKGTSRNNVGFLAAGMMQVQKAPVQWILKLMSYKAAPQYTQSYQL